jgi:hypothetical protein
VSALLILIVATVALVGCAAEQVETVDRPVPLEGEKFWEGDAQVDTVGWGQLSAADSLIDHAGITFIETTLRFPAEANEGEVFAWEFYASRLTPVKLLIDKYASSRDFLALAGESETVLPKQIGFNRVVLKEPIPVSRGYMFGIVQPEAPAIPFKKVINWRTLITAREFQRPIMRRDRFTMYGWRFAARVL